jgi:polyisoprenoid-binding protein YceI
MKTHKVTITETLSLEVEIQASSRTEAEQIAERNWKNSDYILDASHFKGATFKAERPQKQRGYDR